MLKSQTKPDKQKVCRTSVIDNWLAERSQVIVMYCKLSGYRNQTKLPETEQINGFCDILVDYVSAGHFEVYQQIVKECDVNGPSSLELLNRLYPSITKTTDVVVDFNDKYSKMLASDNDMMQRFDRDLSQLGEAIAKRVDLEDGLIEKLQSKH